MDKKELRKKYIEVRKSISEEARSEESAGITEKLLAVLEQENYDALLMYAPKEFEVDIFGLFDAANIPVFFPRCEGDTMNFYKADNPDQLTEGSFGVREPDKSCPMFIPKVNEHYLIVVPGVAFDEKGYRIGYGRGYYDRYLSDVNGYDFYKIGVCFKECLIKDTFHDEFDIRTDKVIY